MRDKKNIDRLFQENLKDYEVFPPNKSWGAIQKQMNSEPKKQRTSIWLKLSSIAALLLLFFSVGTIYLMPDNKISKNFASNKNNSKTTLEADRTSDKVAETSNNTTKNTTSKGKVIPLNAEEISNFEGENEQFSVENKEKKTADSKSLTSLPFQDSKGFAYKQKKKVFNNDLAESKFTVATIFAPIYFNSFGQGSGVDAQFNDNETLGKTSFSYGVKFTYKLNNKFSVQSGVNLINLGQTTNNVYIAPGVAVVTLSNISSQPSLAKNGSAFAKDGLDLSKENSASLNQVFGYVEIPVEIKYNVIEGKVGVNLIGGFSTLLLNKDEVFIETNSISQSLGNSNNLRSVNFSGNFGVDIDYSIYKNLFINVSPMFKVQTNTFSKTSGNAQSYYLGVYTGLNYKF